MVEELYNVVMTPLWDELLWLVFNIKKMLVFYIIGATTYLLFAWMEHCHRKLMGQPGRW